MNKKKTMTVRPTTWTACAFKFSALAAIFISFNAHSFEYKDYEKKIKNGYSLRSAVEKFPKADLELNLREFVASGRPNRLVGSPGHEKAQAYLEKRLVTFNNLNATFKKQEVLANGKKGTNLLWQKTGVTKPDEVLILGANYDTLIRDAGKKAFVTKGEMPGADNNGSGVAMLLSMIEILNKLDLPKSVLIVFFDGEEFESAGSKEFVKSLNLNKGEKKFLGFINLTMLAHDSKLTDKNKKLNNMSVYLRPRDQPGNELDGALMRLITEAGARNYKMIEFSPKESMSGNYFPETAKSFWDQGIPAITMTENREDDLNPRYMTSNDFVETLNFNTYSNAFRYITSAVLAWEYDIVK